MSALTLALAKTHLNITVATFDTELQTVIDAAEAALTRHVGPFVSTATTDRVVPVGTRLRLSTSPAISLTSVTPASESALTLSDLYLDTKAGVVTYNSGAWFSSLYYTVVYDAGRSSVPDDLLMAVKELVRHLWDTQRGPLRRPGTVGSETLANTLPGSAYTFPHRVTELIAPHLQSGFA